MHKGENVRHSSGGSEPSRSAPRGAASSASPGRDPKRPLRLRKRVAVLVRRMGVWLDAWGLRGYPQDTHDWSSKVERLRSMKTTSHHHR